MAGTGAAMSFEAFDVVVVPFPFTDRKASKRRPALVLSTQAFNLASRHSVLAMITSAEQSRWMSDCAIGDLQAAGLSAPCMTRLKLFTLDHRLITRVCGRLAAADQKRLRAAWKGVLAVP